MIGRPKVPLPGRAHHRPRPPYPQRGVGRGQEHRGRGQHRSAHHPVHGGGGAARRQELTVIDRGPVIAEGTADELKDGARRTAPSRSVSTVSDRDGSSSVLARVGRRRPRTWDRGAVRVLRPRARRLPHAHGRGAGARRRRRASPTTSASTSPTLDDVFLSLTGDSTPSVDPVPTATSRRAGRMPSALSAADLPDPDGAAAASTSRCATSLTDTAVIDPAQPRPRSSGCHSCCSSPRSSRSCSCCCSTSCSEGPSAVRCRRRPTL